MDPATIGALITTGGSLLGKLFGGGSEKTESTINYQELRKKAEKGGFNPLTALRAGGGAGFTTTHSPSLASGQFIADALAGVGNVVASIDPMRDATAKLEHEIKQATLASIQADTAYRLRATSAINGAPVSTGARNVRAGSVLASRHVAPQTPTVETPTATNPYSKGSGLTIRGDIPDAAAAEERYGDVLSNVFGVYNAYEDMYSNFKRWADQSRASSSSVRVLPALRRNASSWWE